MDDSIHQTLVDVADFLDARDFTRRNATAFATFARSLPRAADSLHFISFFHWSAGTALAGAADRISATRCGPFPMG